MQIKEIIEELEKRLGVSAYKVGKMLNLSSSHIYRFKKGIRTPSAENANKIIKLAKTTGWRLTLDMFQDNPHPAAPKELKTPQ